MTLLPLLPPQVQEVVPDTLLLQLLVAWLSPSALPAAAALKLPADLEVENVRPWKPGYEREAAEQLPAAPPAQCCREQLGLPSCDHCPLLGGGSLEGGVGKDHAPLQVGHSLRALCLEVDAAHARSARQSAAPPAGVRTSAIKSLALRRTAAGLYLFPGDFLVLPPPAASFAQR